MRTWVGKSALRTLAITILTLLGGAGGAGAEPILYAAFAEVFAREVEFVCSTCTNPTETYYSDEDGGVNRPRGAVSAGTPDRATSSAYAVLTGPNELPVLGAMASAQVFVEENPIAPRVFMYSANAAARGLQVYRFLGTEPEIYTLSYEVHGTITGGPADANNNSITGGIAVFSGQLDLFSERSADLGVEFSTATGNGGVVPVHMGGSVSFLVNPFDSFTVSSSLAAFASSNRGVPASADAMNTLNVSFTQGNTSLLVAGITQAPSVAEPTTIALLTLGLTGASARGLRRIRRRSQASTRAATRPGVLAP